MIILYSGCFARTYVAFTFAVADEERNKHVNTNFDPIFK